MSSLKPLTLRQNFSWTFLGNLVSSACQWGILISFAKLGNPEMVGQFTLGLAITAPVVMFTNLQLRVIQATDNKRQFEFNDYLGLRSLAIALTLLVISMVVAVGNYPSTTVWVILGIGFAKAIESCSDVCYGKLQQAELMDRVSISSMLRSFLAFVFSSMGLWISGSIIWAVLGLAIAWAITLIFYDFPNVISILHSESPAHHIRPRWHRPTLIQLVQLTLPLGVVMMLISLNTNIPRYFLEHYLGERELGFFAAIAYLMYAGQTIESALGQSASPRLASYFTAGNYRAFQSLLLKLIAIGIGVGGMSIGVAILGGRSILTLLYTAEYADSVNIFVWIMITMTIEYIASFLCYGLIAARYLWVQVPLFLTVTLTSTLLCLWLIPAYGLQGAAFVLLISTTLRAAISGAVVWIALQRLKVAEVY